MKYPQLVSMPSAVSDWLEEQLEARGIDAVVYTRYVLSLLHSHPVDVIYSDEDLHFSRLKKEVRRSGGGRKRFRRSSEWWRHAQAEAEQLKRSAAVQCLMSASDQNCEIEALVDELCEKLKEIKSEAQPAQNAEEKQTKQASPQEQAEKYYAAFPPLCRNSSPKLISLIPKWIQSPKKKARKPKKTEEAMKGAKGKRFIRTGKKEMRTMAKSVERDPEGMNTWDFNMFGKKKWVQREPKATIVPSKEDQCVESKQAWSNEDDLNMYDDLPVDIIDLLDSPAPHSVEMMNLANMRDTGQRGFIPSGTNITSSIWSSSEDKLDYKFSNICIDKSSDWVAEKPLEPFKHEQWGGQPQPEVFENELLLNRIALSLIKINHNKETSSFAEIVPLGKVQRQLQFNPFCKPNLFSFNIRRNSEKEDLLTSEKSHFCPINEKAERALGQYADGATFIISNNLDRVNYKRSESGSMLLETELGISKKYYEYREESISPLPHQEFVLKFSISQNDKACQTEFVQFDDLVVDEELEVHASMEYEEEFDGMSEIVWKNGACDKCNNNNNWNSGWKEEEWDSLRLRSIWDGQVCQACLNNGKTASQNWKLREDISLDGEELLLDLNRLQKCVLEDCCEFGGKERKRRHSLIINRRLEEAENSRSSWSFASRLEEDCLIQMSTIPTLRSVTL